MKYKALLLIILMSVFFAGTLVQFAGAHVRQRSRAKPRTGETQQASVLLTEKGYEPLSLKLRRGVPARVTLTRKVSSTCATEVVFPEYGIKRALLLNDPVVVEFTPDKAGEFTFSCGMGMLKGALVVR